MRLAAFVHATACPYTEEEQLPEVVTKDPVGCAPLKEHEHRPRSESSLRPEKTRVRLHGLLSALVRRPTLTEAPSASNANHRGSHVHEPDRRLSCAQRY